MKAVLHYKDGALLAIDIRHMGPVIEQAFVIHRPFSFTDPICVDHGIEYRKYNYHHYCRSHDIHHYYEA